MKNKSERIFFLMALIIIFGKLWLTQGLSLSANNYFYDDRLYLNLSDSILKGQWLGTYNYLILTKYPGYPLWIALNFIIGIPLLLSQQLFYTFAIGLIVYLFKPYIRWQILLLIIFSILLFDPHSYSPRLLRLSREGIYSSQTILLFSCFFGLVSSQRSEISKFLLWSIALGLSLSIFWLTREEGIWIVPSLILIIGYFFHSIWLGRFNDRGKRLTIFLIPFFLLAIAILTLNGINYNKYGIFCSNELKSSAFKKAFGSLTRVEHEKWQRYIYVPKDTRGKIYAVSPSFKELRSYLEGDIGKNWATFSTARLGEDETKGDIGGGWFQWALRESVAAAGYHNNARQALQFYNKLGDEINSACDAGVLKCNARRSSTIAPWRSELIPFLKQAFIQNSNILLSYRFNKPAQILSDVDGPGFILFSDITLGKVAQPKGEIMPTHHQTSLNKKKIKWLTIIFKVYKDSIKYLIIIAGGCFIVNTIRSITRKKIEPLFLFNISIILAIFSRLMMLAYVEATSFFSAAYIGPVYPLLLLFSFSTLIELFFHLHRKNTDDQI